MSYALESEKNAILIEGPQLWEKSVIVLSAGAPRQLSDELHKL